MNNLDSNFKVHKCPSTSTSVEEFIRTVNDHCLKVLTTGEKVLHWIEFPISPELNEQLKDTPENQKNWEKIYRNVPEPFLSHTMRAWSPQTTTPPDGWPFSPLAIFVETKLDKLTERQKKALIKMLEERTNS